MTRGAARAVWSLTIMGCANILRRRPALSRPAPTPRVDSRGSADEPAGALQRTSTNRREMATAGCGLADSGAWGDSDDEISVHLDPPAPLGIGLTDPPAHRMDESLLSPSSFFARRDVVQPCGSGSAPVRQVGPHQQAPCFSPTPRSAPCTRCNMTPDARRAVCVCARRPRRMRADALAGNSHSAIASAALCSRNHRRRPCGTRGSSGPTARRRSRPPRRSARP